MLPSIRDYTNLRFTAHNNDKNTKNHKNESYMFFEQKSSFSTNSKIYKKKLVKSVSSYVAFVLNSNNSYVSQNLNYGKKKLN